MTYRIGPVRLNNLEFNRVPVDSVSSRGTPYLRWKRVGMPKINREFIESVFFLYKSRQDAENGVGAEGTGFVVDHRGKYFAVTNRHVAVDIAASVIRLNTKSGKADILEFDPLEWETVAGGDDIAVIQIALDSNLHQVSAIRTDLFLPSNQHHDIGVGDDVFMIGLFADHEGQEKNNPLARFGNIAMMADPDSPVRSQGKDYEAFIVDMHSRSGFSGSPVFVYRTFGGDLENPTYGHSVTIPAIDIARGIERKGGFLENDLYSLDGAGRKIELQMQSKIVLYILGVNLGQYSELWQIKKKSNTDDSDATHVKGTSGLSAVAPAWKIMEVIQVAIAKNEAAGKSHPEARDEIELDSRRDPNAGDDISRKTPNISPYSKATKSTDS